MLKDMGDSLIRLYDAVRDSRGKDTTASRTARLLHAGPRKIAKKVAEEAAEVALEAAMATVKTSSARAPISSTILSCSGWRLASRCRTFGTKWTAASA
jgi:hypothetical protein